MDEKTTSKYASLCPSRTYGFCNWPESAPIGPNWPQRFPMVPFGSELARFGPFRSPTDRQTPRHPAIISEGRNSYGFSLGALTVTVSILPPSVLALLSANVIFTRLSGCPISTLKTLSAGLVIVVSGALSKS